MGKLLGREDILNAPDIETVTVKVPEWGGAVLVRGLTGEERDIYEQSLIRVRGKKRDVDMRNARARLVAMCVVDENGDRIFSDEDVAALGKKSSAALDRVFDVAQRLSGLREEDMEELAGN